ncbi:MAG: hypothetical protein ACXVE4_00480 [Solirubrobacteraceae bacterium]
MAPRSRVDAIPVQHSPGAVAKRPAGVGGDLSGLMAAAGNRAVARMVRTLQRDDYTKTVTDVEKTGISRLEVHGLKYGIDDFEARYGDKPKDVSDERHKTKESPGHMAVVLVPDTLDLDQPVQVILHFHGWGFRSFDPYAGYLIAAKDSSASAGTVRDVAQEHWEQQIASLKGQGAQVVAILAQGRGKSDFGSFPTFEYVRDVLEKSGRSELVKLAEGENYSVIFSAHSGGGSTKVVPMLGQGEAETADRGGLKSQLPSKTEHRVINKLQPVDLVVLYEALNWDGDVDNVMDWVRAQLTRLVGQLDANPAKALAATPVLRGHYGKRKDSGYRAAYRRLACLIAEEIDARVPDAHRQDVADRFRVIEVTGTKGGDVEHEQVISGTGTASTGSLADALRAARNPQGDRAQAVSVGAEECVKLKRDAKARAAARKAAAEAAAKERAKAKGG